MVKPKSNKKALRKQGEVGEERKKGMEWNGMDNEWGSNIKGKGWITVFCLLLFYDLRLHEALLPSCL